MSTHAEIANSPPLVARWAPSAPLIDGHADAVWTSAAPLALPLTWGIRGSDPASSAELRALYTAEAVYFLARWPDPSSPKSEDARLVANKLTMHWTLPPPKPGLAAPACNVACHTAYDDQAGRIVDMRAETIPPGADEALPVAGAWRDGAWTLEWTRPLRSENPNDLQFSDLRASYPFFVKIFEGHETLADPVSPTRMLVFAGK